MLPLIIVLFLIIGFIIITLKTINVVPQAHAFVIEKFGAYFCT